MRNIGLFLLIICFVFVSYTSAPGRKEEQQRARVFDSYGWINSEDAGARLDNFAIELQSNPDVGGYIVGYGPEGEGSGTGNFMLGVTKNYLINLRGIDEERLQVIYGGRYKDPAEVATELWIIPPDAHAPEPKHYKNKIDTIKGKFTEGEAWDGFADGADGPSFGNVTLAAFADALRQQPKTIAYIIAFNMRGATPGTWRRVAKRDESSLQGYGIEADRIKIIYGGIIKNKEDEYAQQALVQLWILPGDAPPPVKEAKPERTPKEAVQIGSYNDYLLKYPDNERWIFEGFADVLRANERLSVCIIYRPRIEGGEEFEAPDEPPDIELSKLVEKWTSELMENYKLKESRIVVLPAIPNEFNEGTVEVWVVPPGAALPDPYAANDEMMETDEPE